MRCSVSVVNLSIYPSTHDSIEKWQVDEDKLTFIILSREGIELPADCSPQDTRLSGCPMVGDVNIFINGALDTLLSPLKPDEEDEGHAEVEIMIAGELKRAPMHCFAADNLGLEPSYRRRGYAREALQLMLHYATGYPFFPKTISSPLKIDPTRLLTKISETNAPSISLFESLGFKLTKRISVFSEVEMRWSSERSS